MRAAALTVDLKGSRKLKPERREQVQRYMIHAAEAVNRIFERVMLRELCFNGGDELQALLSGPADAFLCLRLLRRILFPLEVHAGIGAGEWETRIENKNSFYQDGSAYHRARDAVELAKRDRDSIAILNCGDDNIQMRGRNPVWNAMMNAGFQLMERNTAYQNEMALLVECIWPIRNHNHALMGTNDLGFPEPDELIRLLRDLLQSREAEALYGLKNAGTRRRPFAEASLERTYEANHVVYYEPKAAEGKDLWHYEGAHPFGAASAAAFVSGLTRQAVDTALRASNVYAERALALALRDELSKAWEGLDRD